MGIQDAEVEAVVVNMFQFVSIGRAAVRDVIDVRRSETRRRVREGRYAAERAARLSALASGSNTDLLLDIKDILNRYCTEQEREIGTRKLLLEQSLRTVAREMGLKFGAVKSRWRRIKRTLRLRLE